MLTPHSPEELAEAMGSAGARKQAVVLGGAFSKRAIAGPLAPADVTISTTGLSRILQYEPNDLTISVGAGMRWCELSRSLAENRQMIPLDPPFTDEATVGGVVATNSSGPRRRLYGTARDMVIGMKFAAMDGRLAQSGGMVVKNVAGLDMAKLLIGSYGTLAAIAVVNFKLMPRPECERSIVLSFDTAEEAGRARTAVLNSVLQPEAIDMLSPDAARTVGAEGYLLAVQAGGNRAVVGRYERELAALGTGKAFDGPDDAALWRAIANFTPRYLAANPQGSMVRVSCPLADVPLALESAAVARAGSGVAYVHWPTLEQGCAFARQAVGRGWKAVVEFAPEARKNGCELWPAPGNDLELMQRVKRMFDPEGLLNRGRLYGRI